MQNAAPEQCAGPSYSVHFQSSFLFSQPSSIYIYDFSPHIRVGLEGAGFGVEGDEESSRLLVCLKCKWPLTH